MHNLWKNRMFYYSFDTITLKDRSCIQFKYMSSTTNVVILLYTMTNSLDKSLDKLLIFTFLWEEEQWVTCIVDASSCSLKLFTAVYYQIYLTVDTLQYMMLTFVNMHCPHVGLKSNVISLRIRINHNSYTVFRTNSLCLVGTCWTVQPLHLWLTV